MNYKPITIFGRAAIPIMSNEHNLIHAGKYFTSQVANAALGASASLLIEMIIPANIELHLKRFSYYNGDDGEFEFIEAPTLTTGAAVLTSYNRNRESVKASGIILKSNPTGISAGTLLENMFFKGTNQTPSILVNRDVEWVLKSGTTYLLRLTNDGVAAEQALLKAGWYEMEEE